MPDQTSIPTRTRPSVLPGIRTEPGPGPDPGPGRRLHPDELCPQQKTDVGEKTRRILRP